ncbi:MAG TPA: CBS domain-containing protein [Terriglobales bacterium]|jgi:CBS domain-containing protein
MKTVNPCKPASELILRARTAAEMMTPNPVSIGQDSTVLKAANFLTGRGISAAPVIDDAGRPVGVVSRSDIVVPYQMASAGRTPVHALMTPTVFCVHPDASAQEVVEMMVGLGVRRLFVVDDSDVLVGVISALDVMRHLCRRKRRVA